MDTMSNVLRRCWWLLPTLCLGCASGADLARDRASREYDCPSEKIKVRWLNTGPNNYEIYKVAACGTVATYACHELNGTCVKESDDRSAD